MNIAQQLYESAQQYGAKFELNEGQGLRLNHADHVPDALITQIRQFKPEIIQYLQQCAISDLIDSIYQYGANIEVIDGQQLRLDHAYHIPDQLITQIKQLKPQILAYLTPSTEQDQQGHNVVLHVYNDIKDVPSGVGGVLKSMLTLNEAIIDVKKG